MIFFLSNRRIGKVRNCWPTTVRRYNSVIKKYSTINKRVKNTKGIKDSKGRTNDWNTSNNETYINGYRYCYIITPGAPNYSSGNCPNTLTCCILPTRIDPIDGIIVYIQVPIECIRIAQTPRLRVLLRPPSQIGIVVACAELDQARAALKVASCILSLPVPINKSVEKQSSSEDDKENAENSGSKLPTCFPDPDYSKSNKIYYYIENNLVLIHSLSSLINILFIVFSFGITTGGKKAITLIMSKILPKIKIIVCVVFP
jgi:hypothetical protein